MKTAVLCLSVALLAACATETPKSDQGQTQAGNSDQVCVNEPVSGSHIAHRICMSKEAYEQRQQKAQDVMERATMGRPRPKKTEGGG